MIKIILGAKILKEYDVHSSTIYKAKTLHIVGIIGNINNSAEPWNTIASEPYPSG